MTGFKTSSSLRLALEQLPQQLSYEERAEWEAVYASIFLLQDFLTGEFGSQAGGADLLSSYFSVLVDVAEVIPPKSFVRMTPEGLRLANWGSLLGFTDEGAVPGTRAVVVMQGTVSNPVWNLVPGQHYIVNDSAQLWTIPEVPNISDARPDWRGSLSGGFPTSCYSCAGVAVTSTDLVLNPVVGRFSQFEGFDPD